MDEESRTIEGWASTFGNKDGGNDIIVPGAFAESIKLRKPKMLWQHDSQAGDRRLGIGHRDERQIRASTSRAASWTPQLGDDAYKLARAGAIDQHEHRLRRQGRRPYDQKTGVRTLKKLGTSGKCRSSPSR